MSNLVIAKPGAQPYFGPTEKDMLVAAAAAEQKSHSSQGTGGIQRRAHRALQKLHPNIPIPTSLPAKSSGCAGLKKVKLSTLEKFQAFHTPGLKALTDTLVEFIDMVATRFKQDREAGLWGQ